MNDDRQHGFCQHDEESFILPFFDRNPPEHRIFCDIGAFDGVLHSNTRALYLAGWSGHLCEPHPAAFDELAKTYPQPGVTRCTIQQVAIAPKHLQTNSGEAWLYFPIDKRKPDEPHDPRECSTLLQSQFERWGAMYAWSQIEVRAATLEEVMPEHTAFLTVDAEGMDYDILASKDWSHRRPALVMAEHNGDLRHLRGKINALLTEYGYHIVFDNGQNAAWSFYPWTKTA